MVHQGIECFGVVKQGGNVFEDNTRFWKVRNIPDTLHQDRFFFWCDCLHLVSFIWDNRQILT